MKAAASVISAGVAARQSATRTARAGSDEDARNALKRIEIVESVSENKVALDSARGGIGM